MATTYRLGARHNFAGKLPDGFYFRLGAGDPIPPEVVAAHAANLDQLVKSGVFVPDESEPVAEAGPAKKRGRVKGGGR